MTAETAMVSAVIALALLMGVAIIYSVCLSFHPRYRPEPPATPPTTIGRAVECRAVREAWAIIDAGFARNDEQSSGERNHS